MDCREAGTQLIAFHDGELPEAERAAVEGHLRGCAGCRALLSDLSRADGAAGVPDPGPEYWERFNGRLAERIRREEAGRAAPVLRPKGGWLRHQLRYLVPAVAAAALVVVVVRHAGVDRGEVRPIPQLPVATAPPAPAPKPPAPGIATSRRPEPAGRREAEAGPPPSPTVPSSPAPAFEARLRAAGAVPAESPAPAPLHPEAGAATGEARVGAAAGIRAAPSPPRPERSAKSTGGESVDPCRSARELAAEGRLAEAEAAQRDCLGRDTSPQAQEAGLVYLAELLDRQARFADADAVLDNAARRFPGSRPLERYRRQRPTLQPFRPTPSR